MQAIFAIVAPHCRLYEHRRMGKLEVKPPCGWSVSLTVSVCEMFCENAGSSPPLGASIALEWLDPRWLSSLAG